MKEFFLKMLKVIPNWLPWLILLVILVSINYDLITALYGTAVLICMYCPSIAIFKVYRLFRDYNYNSFSEFFSNEKKSVILEVLPLIIAVILFFTLPLYFKKYVLIFNSVILLLPFGYIGYDVWKRKRKK